MISDRDACVPAFRKAVQQHAADGTLSAYLEEKGAEAIGVPKPIDAAKLAALLDEAERDYQRAAEILDMPRDEFETALADFSADVEMRGNPLTLAMLPAVGRMYTTMRPS